MWFSCVRTVRTFRHLALLLAVLLPLKALAAVVLPITGLPQHRHADHAIEVLAATPHCDADTDSDANAHPSTLHEHTCPHLGMASIPPVIFSLDIHHTHPRAEVCPALPPASVVLDVPHPPPTA